MLTHRFGYGNGLRNAFGWMLRIALVLTLFSIPLMAYMTA